MIVLWVYYMCECMQIGEHMFQTNFFKSRNDIALRIVFLIIFSDYGHGNEAKH